jgi:hypothetical protein
MRKFLQFMLLVLGVLALVVLLADIVYSIQATTRSGSPVRVEEVKAGSYDLLVSFYKYPANAGYALPFAIAPKQPVQGTLTYQVNSIPSRGVDATPIRAGLSTDPNIKNGVQGTAEVTVHGDWSMRIAVAGPSGPATGSVDLPVIAPPTLPVWLGWFVGLVPLYGLLGFVLLLRNRKASVVEPLQTVPAMSNR